MVGGRKVWKNALCLILLQFVKISTADDRMWKVTMMLHRGVFRYHSYKALPREGTVVRMFHLHAALDHGAYSCRQRHQFKSLC
jgi:hypothetical protein